MGEYVVCLAGIALEKLEVVEFVVVIADVSLV